MTGQAPWRCWCPEIVHDADGHSWPCKLLATIERDRQLPSTSGPVTLVRTVCGAGHSVDVLLEDLQLLV